MIDLYAWTSANGRRPIIMLEETGTPYRITAIDPHSEAKNTAEYRAISPGREGPLSGGSRWARRQASPSDGIQRHPHVSR